MYMCNKRLVPFSSISWLTKLSRGPAPAYLLIKARRLAKYAMKLSTVTPPMKWSTFDNKEVTTSSRNWFYQEEWSSHRLSWHIKKACCHCKVVLCILCKELWGQTKLRKQKGQGLSEGVPLGARDHPNVVDRIVWTEKDLRAALWGWKWSTAVSKQEDSLLFSVNSRRSLKKSWNILGTKFGTHTRVLRMS